MKWFSCLLVAVLLLAAPSCSRDPEVLKRKYVETGNRYFERGKYKEASIMYRSALKKDMRYAEAYYRLALTQLKLPGQRLQVAGVLRRAVSLWEEERAAQAKRTGRKPAASTELMDARRRLAETYVAAYLVRPDKNRALIREIKEIAETMAAEDPRSFEAIRLRGYLALIEGKRQEAIQLFRQANEVKPFDPEVIRVLCQTLAAESQFEEAEKLAKSLIEKEKSFGAIYDFLYGEYVRRKRPADAENILKLKVSNNPKELRYALALAAHYYASNKPDECDRVMQGVLAAPGRFSTPNVIRTAGDFYRQLREYEKALAAYRKGIETKEGGKVEFQQRIAEILATQGKRVEASRMIEEILKEHPKDSAAEALKATLKLESGDPSQIQTAVSELEAAVTRLPQNPVVRFNLGRAYLAKGDLDRARAQFEEALRLRTDFPAARLWLGQVQLLKGEFLAALTSAEEVLKWTPGDPQAILIRALSKRSLGKYEEARRELVDLVAKNPNSIEPRFQLGLLEVSRQNYKDAEKVFSDCNSLATSDTRCLLGLSSTYAEQKNFDKAIQVLQAAQQRLPDRKEIRMALANTSMMARKYDMAIGLYQEMIAKEPDSVELHLRLGETLRRKGDVDSAIEHFQKAKQLEPNDPRAYVPLAVLLDSIGRDAEAKTVYEQILRFQPDNGLALNNLAYIIAETGNDLDLALTYAQRAKQRYPQDPNVADTLGWIYIKKNLSANAIQIYQELVTKTPTSPTYRYHFGIALYQKGDRVQAKKELEAALRNGPSRDEAAKIRTLLEKIG